MYKVILLRGKKSPCEWEHPDKKGALRRALALKYLHGNCPLYEDGQKIVVDASGWYR